MIYAAAMLLEGALYGVITKNRMLSYGIMVLTAILWKIIEIGSCLSEKRCNFRSSADGGGGSGTVGNLSVP